MRNDRSTGPRRAVATQAARAHALHAPRAICAVVVTAMSGAAALLFASCSTPPTSTPAPPPTPIADARDDAPAEDAGPAQPAGWDEALRLKVLPDLDPAPGVVEVRLEARVAPIALAGVSVDMWTYEGTLPGPTIRAHRGDKVVVHFKNSLPAPTTIHWHGVRVPNAMDGVPDVTQRPVPPGGTFDYAFTVPESGTYWYHPHVASSTQVGYGLYGALVVEDAAPADSGVPSSDELTLVLSDVSVTDAGVLETPDATGGLGDYFGREGTLALVNGKPRATLKARPGLPQRWRVVNASRARYAALELPGFDVYRLGGDEGLAESPRRLPFATATVVPGERVELFVVPRGAPGATVTVTWNSVDRLHTTAPLTKVPVLDVALEGAPVAGRDLPPAKLAPFDPVPLVGVGDAGVTTRALAFIDDRGRLAVSPAESFDVRARTSEVWTVANETGQDHPFHLHGFSFQVLDTGAGPPPQRELRDTVNVVARQRIKIAIAFDGRTGPWMFHCHILDHADVGMMGMFMLR